MPNPPKCPHPRGQYDVDCPVCDVKKRRAQRRRETRTGDGAPVERFTLRDVEDLLSAQRHLSMAITSIDEEIDTVELAWGPGAEEALGDVLRRREDLIHVSDAITRVFGRHERAVEAVRADPPRRYKRRTSES